jgi:hypothetical protein
VPPCGELCTRRSRSASRKSPELSGRTPELPFLQPAYRLVSAARSQPKECTGQAIRNLEIRERQRQGWLVGTSDVGSDGDGRPRLSAECRASRLLSFNLEAVGVDSRNTSILFRCLVAALCSLFPSHLPEVQMLRTKLLQPSKRLGRRKHFPHTLFGISAPAVPLARSIVAIRRGRRRFIVQGLEE